MPTFEYQAQAADGREVNGRVIGASLDQALQDLVAKGMQITKIGLAGNPNDPLAGMSIASTTVQGATPAESAAEETGREEPVYDYGPPTGERSYAETSIWGPLVGQVPLPALLFFFRQASTMFEAGVPAVQALETLAGQSQSAKLSGIIREIAGHVKAGRPISAGLQRYPEVFSPIVVSLVRSGEQGGFLDNAMGIVAGYLEREIELRNLYKRVTFYPKLQVGLSMIIIIAANLIIDSLGGTEKLHSPLTTATTWIWLGPLIIALFLFFRIGLANPATKYQWDTIVSKTPYIGETMKQLSMAKFGRAFGALYRGGVPMQKALTLAADSCGNEFLRARMYTAYKGLEDGRGITETFRQTQAFSPIVIDMVGTGEHTGNLDLMLAKVAQYYEEEATTRSLKTGQIMGVTLGLLVAIYIGYIIINFWTSHYAGLSTAG
ncbi:type II secretion system F family protein [Fimbriimonas ginsengisoli]|uniref:Type II secretory pathway, component PulF n=1 Tax=Fimbriimonas ginsengisoli Gsoil 348 TaxID=661478 RepID=A0A068NQF8_FIMGI|nr:type II secretion system F family protein [Fimbriimonas ginsengisoli]AIE85582.1 Type II secretory pathway, component PulF [Fimbriimonas ginsengisoli Gsoil 348]